MARPALEKNLSRSPPRKFAPKIWKGMRIGLLGGSFNPPHAGHVHASEIALKSLDLDAVWWLVSPGNPLKNNSGLPPIDTRIARSRELISNPKLVVSGIEKDFGTRRSLDTLYALKKHFPDVDFIWLAGTDIAYEMHRWHRWRELLRLVPLAFIGRPTKWGLVRRMPLRNMPLRHTVPLNGTSPSLKPGQVFWLFSDPQNTLSSTFLRSQQKGIFAHGNKEA